MHTLRCCRDDARPAVRDVDVHAAVLITCWESAGPAKVSPHLITLPLPRSSVCTDMPSKSIFRQPGAQHFQLVHRSQRDPLINDPDASQHVLKPVVRENAKKVISSSK